MSKDKELEYILKLKDEATAIWKKFSGSVEKESMSLKSVVGGVGTAIGGMFTIAAASKFMKDAAEAQAEVTRLEQALRQQGITEKSVTEAMLAYSEALKEKTGYDDDEITHIQSTILAMTGNLEAVKKLTPAVLDLARGTGMSTEAAAKMFSKSVEGAEGLKKLGIEIGKTSSESERLYKIYEEVTKKFGGQAKAWGETDAGKMQKMQQAFDDAGKSIGKMLNEIIIPMLPQIQAMIGWITKWVPKVVDGIKIAFAELYMAILSPFVLIEKGMNMLGISSIKYFQGLDKAGDNFIKKTTADITKLTSSFEGPLELPDKIVGQRTKSIETLSDKLKRLNDELEKMDPRTAAYIAKKREAIEVENQFKLATERAEHALKGISGVTSDDSFFVTQFNRKVLALNSDLEQTIALAQKSIKKDFGGSVDPAEQKIVEDQAEIYSEIRLKSFESEKDAELAVVDDWEQRAIDMAHENEGLITDIRRVAADERAQIEIDAAVKTFDSIAGFAQRGIQIISKFTQQGYQAEINSLEKAKDKELKAIDAERQAAKDKYDEMMDNENLTAEEKDKLKKQAEDEDKKILARKTALEEQYNQKLADEKTAAFEAEKRASELEAIINTAVEVTKVLATPWMIPIVAGLGAAEVALIASQPTPQFHGGGGAYFDAPESQETMVKIRGKEELRVWTPEQAAERDKAQSSSIVMNLNFYSPFTDTQAVRKAVIAGLKQTGLNVDQFLSTQNNNVVLAQ